MAKDKGKKPAHETKVPAVEDDAGDELTEEQRERLRRRKKPSGLAAKALDFVESGDLADLGNASSYSLQEALLKYAEERAKEGQSVGHSLVLLSKQGDPVADALSHAINAAKAREDTLGIDEQTRILGEHLGGEPQSTEKAEHGSALQMEQVLDRLARAERRDDETVAQTYKRLLETDQVFRDGYECYMERNDSEARKCAGIEE